MPLFVYRCGRNWTDILGHRCVISETWVSETSEAGFTQAQIGLHLSHLATRYAFPIPHAAFNYLGGTEFGERILPRRKMILRGMQLQRQLGRPLLNVHAPEAALRLQRVGAAGPGQKLGRIFLPILNDDPFVDPPHRRRVDPAVWQPMLVLGDIHNPDVISLDGRTYTNSIVNREDFTHQPVDHYVILPSVARLWGRWKVRPALPPFTPLSTWVPPEETWIQ